MTWEDFYDRFYDLAPSTQKKYAYQLSSFGPADEVFEIAGQLSFDGEKFASRFLHKAMDAGVRFTPEQVLEHAIFPEKPLITRMAETASGAFDKEQLEELHLSVDTAAFERISQKLHINIFENDTPEEFEEEELWEEEEDFDDYGLDKTIPTKGRNTKPGFFTFLIAIFSFLGKQSRIKRR